MIAVTILHIVGIFIVVLVIGVPTALLIWDAFDNGYLGELAVLTALLLAVMGLLLSGFGLILAR